MKSEQLKEVATLLGADIVRVADLALLKGIRVDPSARTVRAEGGCTWGGLNHATYPFGLATTGGIIASTGIAGLTLGGGPAI